MEQFAIVESLKMHFSEEVLDSVSHQGQVGVVVRPERIVEVLSWLRDSEAMRMNHLRALCGVDNARRQVPFAGRFEVVYQLYSTALRHEIRIRVPLPKDKPQIDSVVSLWPGANWLERETYDMFGICFNGHPNLNRVLLPEDWEGHPLQKDYPLKGKKEWQGMVELVEKTKRLNQLGFYGQKPTKKKESVQTIKESVPAPPEELVPEENAPKTLRER